MIDSPTAITSANAKATNIIAFACNLFSDNTFRSRQPRNDGFSVLAGRIKHRDEAKSWSLTPEQR